MFDGKYLSLFSIQIFELIDLTTLSVWFYSRSSFPRSHFSMGTDIYRLSSNQGDTFLFFFVFIRLGKVYSPFHSHFKVVEGSNYRKSLTIRQRSPICFVLFPKSDTSRHLHASVFALLKKVSSFKKNPWRKLRNYLTSTSTRTPSAPMCLKLPFWRRFYSRTSFPRSQFIMSYIIILKCCYIIYVNIL